MSDALQRVIRRTRVDRISGLAVGASAVRRRISDRARLSGGRGEAL